MKLALAQAQEALDQGEFPVGCVMVMEGEVLSSGRRDHSRNNSNEIDHAEIIALRALVDEFPEIDLSSVTVYSTMEPCLMCFSTMIVNGIRRMVYSYEDVMGGGTNLELGKLNPFYSSMKLTVVPHVLRNRSLEMFQNFFRQPDNSYLADSFLARYTLEQKPESVSIR